MDQCWLLSSQAAGWVERLIPGLGCWPPQAILLAARLPLPAPWVGEHQEVETLC